LSARGKPRGSFRFAASTLSGFPWRPPIAGRPACRVSEPVSSSPNARPPACSDPRQPSSALSCERGPRQDPGFTTGVAGQPFRPPLPAPFQAFHPCRPPHSSRSGPAAVGGSSVRFPCGRRPSVWAMPFGFTRSGRSDAPRGRSGAPAFRPKSSGWGFERSFRSAVHPAVPSDPDTPASRCARRVGPAPLFPEGSTGRCGLPRLPEFDLKNHT
jgi:hypothetical protein